MPQIVGQWGNNLAIRIPNDINIVQKGDVVDIRTTTDGIIEIVPRTRRRPRRMTMKERLAAEPVMSRGTLEDWGPAAGKELD